MPLPGLGLRGSQGLLDVARVPEGQGAQAEVVLRDLSDVIGGSRCVAVVERYSYVWSSLFLMQESARVTPAKSRATHSYGPDVHTGEGADAVPLPRAADLCASRTFY